MNTDNVQEGIINGYRDFIYNRYQFEAIKGKYEIPNAINESVLIELRAYYLTHVYPEYSERKALNEAFNSLDKYIQQPQKLIAILFDASKLLFKYGRSLPKILGTGLKALKTFKSASNFENTLIKDAVKKKLEGPYDEAKIKVLLRSIPRNDIDEFIETSHSLFETLYDRAQVKKIKEIIRYIIAVMKKNAHRYSKDQIKGLEMGYALLDEGDSLLQQLPKQDQQRLIDLITEIETDMLNNLN